MLKNKELPTVFVRDNTCYTFRDTGACPRGDKCRFDHIGFTSKGVTVEGRQEEPPENNTVEKMV